MIRNMNSWGIEGCREREAEIADRLRDAYKETSWQQSLAAVSRSVRNGLAFRLNPLDPFTGLVREAIRIAEAAKDRR
jgi:hypothetical protein